MADHLGPFELGRVHNPDCLAAMRQLPDGCIDAVVTDPPYFRVKREAWDRQWADAGKFLDWIGQLAEQWARTLKANGSLYVFASPEMASRVECKIGERFNVLNRIRWLKDAGWHKKAKKETLRSYLSPWEEIIFAEQRSDEYADAETRLHQRVYAPIGRAVLAKREAARLRRWEIDVACAPSQKPTGLCYRWEEGACLPTEEQWVALCRRCGDGREHEDLRREHEDLRRPFAASADAPYTDVWTFAPVSAHPGKHPCEKPVALLEHIIRVSTRPGAVVLDGFCGSGSTRVAAEGLGRRFLGFEIDPHWCQVANDRIAAAARGLTVSDLRRGQGQLFAPPAAGGSK